MCCCGTAHIVTLPQSPSIYIHVKAVDIARSVHDGAELRRNYFESKIVSKKLTL